MEKCCTANGLLVVIAGPSGAGKDTLMAAAAAHFSGQGEVHFVRRVITREAEAGGEDHEAVSREEFDRRVGDKAFAVWWGAHGLKYGIPANVCAELAKGHVAVVNGSRSALRAFARIFPRLKVVSVTARPDVLAERLAARGRESRDDILRRLARAPAPVEDGFDTVTIDNSGTVEEAARAFIAVLENALPKATGAKPIRSDSGKGA